MTDKRIDLTAVCCYASDKSVPAPIPYIDKNVKENELKGEWCILFHEKHKDIEDSEFHFHLDEWNEKYAPFLEEEKIQILNVKKGSIGLDEDGETTSLEILDDKPHSYPSEIQ